VFRRDIREVADELRDWKQGGETEELMDFQKQCEGDYRANDSHAQELLVAQMQVELEKEREKLTGNPHSDVDQHETHKAENEGLRIHAQAPETMRDAEFDAEFKRLHEREMQNPRIAKEMPRASQFEKSGRIVMTTFNAELAANEPQARMALLSQLSDFLIRRMIDAHSWPGSHVCFFLYLRLNDLRK
jgi:hypothetical protein